jgi:hypothetical protein
MVRKELRWAQHQNLETFLKNRTGLSVACAGEVPDSDATF